MVMNHDARIDDNRATTTDPPRRANEMMSVYEVRKHMKRSRDCLINSRIKTRHPKSGKSTKGRRHHAFNGKAMTCKASSY